MDRNDEGGKRSASSALQVSEGLLDAPLEPQGYLARTEDQALAVMEAGGGVESPRPPQQQADKKTMPKLPPLAALLVPGGSSAKGQGSSVAGRLEPLKRPSPLRRLTRASSVASLAEATGPSRFRPPEQEHQVD